MKALLLFVLLVCSVPALAANTPATGYADGLLAALPALVRTLPVYAQVAEAVAAPLAQGGKLWLAGDKGFILEGLGRAGGLMMVKQLPKAEAAAPEDVVLYGTFAPPSAEQQATLTALRARGVRVVLMTPDRLQTGTTSVKLLESFTPTQAAPLLTASLWTLTGEIVTALTRRGKLPPLYQSVMVPGGRERNAPHLKLQWEPGQWPAIAPLVLGRGYLATIANDLRSLKSTQAEGFGAAGKLAAATRAAGRTVWYASLGHLPPELPSLPGDPQAARPLTAPAAKLAETVTPGDLILYVGYYEPYDDYVRRAHEAGAKIVTVVSGTPERSAEAMGADLNLEGCWQYGDAVAAVPGYDIQFLPPSGFVAAAAYYMLMAEVQAAR